MAVSGRSGRSRFTLAVLVLSSITVLTLDFRGASFVEDVRSTAASLFAPIRTQAEKLFDPVSDAWNGVVRYGDVEAENERLRAELERRQGDQIEAEDAKRQLDELKELERLPVVRNTANVTARVSGGPLSSFERTIRINQGSGRGIKVGMPVANGAGLVGRVVQVTSNESVVELLTDPNVAVGIRLVRSGEVGVARGTGSGNPLVVDDGIAPTAEVTKGEPVVTSGHSRSLFPPDVPIGKVVRVDLSSSKLTQELRIEPLADLDNLGYVKVLLWEPEA